MDSELKRLMTPSISLLVLSALTPPEHRVEIIDENITPVINYNDADLVGITCNVDNFERAKVHSERFRKNGIPVILGGIFPSSSPEIAEIQATSVCIGDAEPIWATILHDAKYGQLKRRYEWHGDYPVEMIPRPKWESIDRNKYLYTNVITTSRGCPFSCEFCYNSCEYMNKKYRRRPVDAIIEEIERLEKEGRIIDSDLRNYNTSKVVFKPKNMTPDELLKGYLNIYKDFYSLKNILKRKSVSRQQWVPYFLFNIFYRKFGKFTSLFALKGNMGRIGKMARSLSYGIG